MKQLFKTIEELIPTLPGWCDVEKAQTLAALVIALRPKVSLELGVYAGRSLFALALAHKHLGHGIAYGIDPWDNVAASEGYTEANRDWWMKQDLEALYRATIEKTLELSIGNVTSIVRRKSDDFEIDKPIDLLHVDGLHTEQAVRDVMRFAPKVPVGGIVVMDDTSWQNSGDAPVARAVDTLKKMGFQSLYLLGTGEVFQRVK